MTTSWASRSTSRRMPGGILLFSMYIYRTRYGLRFAGQGRSLEPGLYEDVIPLWCAALHFAFSAIPTAASQGPRTVFKDVQVALGRPAPWPYLRP